MASKTDPNPRPSARRERGVQTVYLARRWSRKAIGHVECLELVLVRPGKRLGSSESAVRLAMIHQSSKRCRDSACAQGVWVMFVVFSDILRYLHQCCSLPQTALWHQTHTSALPVSLGSLAVFKPLLHCAFLFFAL